MRVVLVKCGVFVRKTTLMNGRVWMGARFRAILLFLDSKP